MANEQLKTLEDKLSYAYDTKVAIKDAIEAKGVEVPEGTVFRDYATKIGEIESGTQVQTATIKNDSITNVYAVNVVDGEFCPALIRNGSELSVIKGSIVIFDSSTQSPQISGDIEFIEIILGFNGFTRGIKYRVFGDCTIGGSGSGGSSGN